MDSIHTMTLPGGTAYELADQSARQGINEISTIVPASASLTNKLATQNDIVNANTGLSIINGQVCITYEE